MNISCSFSPLLYNRPKPEQNMSEISKDDIFCCDPGNRRVLCCAHASAGLAFLYVL